MKLITDKSKNLLYRIVDTGNVTVQYGTSYAIATQISADTAVNLSFKLLGYKNNGAYTYIFSDVKVPAIGKITKTFITPSTTEFDYICFGLNGSKIDTKCVCHIDLKPSTTYTFTCNFTNITQGSISWKDMMLVEGSEAGDYEPYSYNLLDKRKFKATSTKNGVTFINNEDGTITADGIPTKSTYYDVVTYNRIVDHKYLVSCNYNRNVFTGLKMETQSGSEQVNFNPDDIFTATSTVNNVVLYIDVYPDHIGPSVVIPQLYDLTLMYGAGNEPTTVAQFYQDHPELKVSPLGFIGLKNLEISNKNIKRLKLKTTSGNVDLGIIPSNSGYILDEYNNLTEELLEENVEKDNISYHIPDKTNILLNKVEGKTNKIVQLLDPTKYASTKTLNGVTYTKIDNGYRLNGTCTGSVNYDVLYNIDNPPIHITKGHKYLLLDNRTNVISSTSANVTVQILNVGATTIFGTSDMMTEGVVFSGAASQDADCYMRIRIEQGVTYNNVILLPQFFDLTAMYGYGKEPTTVEQFKKDYPQFFDEKLDGIWNVRTSGISTKDLSDNYDKIDLLSTQTLNGINGVNDYIEVIDKGNGLYDLKKTQNIDSVDLGTLTWDIDSSNFYSSSINSVIKPATDNAAPANCVCDKYTICSINKSFVNGDFAVNATGYIYFRNSAYTTAAAFKTAVTGTILYYQLATPVTTTIATNLTYSQVSALRTNGGLLLVNENINQKYVQPNVTIKENYAYIN